ncbi:hypothetical protein J2S17_005411 [Cytobacillus purgationiresistens]|uniref:Uncharacterized protein n=1 Tax=Cytobacillus purgationiresistens TaxID=863449 RepID=A0ABU0AQD6_9BACI|nr:hypothetical protein [Cytobacillus purgationiresistens]
MSEKWRGFQVIEEKKRKVRSDKKRDVKPTVNQQLHECIYRLSYITNNPVKDVGVHICLAGIESKKVIELLSNSFRRNYRMGQTVYFGELEHAGIQIQKEGIRKRLTLRFVQASYDQIADLAYALDVTPSSATAILLDAAVRNTEVVNEYLREYVEENLDKNRVRELKEVLQFINKNNPYDEEITLTMLVSYLFEDFMDSTRNISKVIGEWIDKYK